jgi:hypothetical protein
MVQSVDLMPEALRDDDERLNAIAAELMVRFDDQPVRRLVGGFDRQAADRAFVESPRQLDDRRRCRWANRTRQACRPSRPTPGGTIVVADGVEFGGQRPRRC